MKMRFEVYKDGKGEWRWRLLARNGRLVADCGEGYARRAQALKAVGRVQLCASARVVVEEA